MINMMVYSILMLFNFVFMFFMSMMMYFMEFNMLIEWLMFSINSFEMKIIILLDWISLLFVSFVMLISSKVMMYSVSYMNNDKLVVRFTWLMCLFIFSMIMMIISPSIFSILFGWDGLGLVSFCLVIYYQNYLAYNSGMITVLCNRIGDIGILMTISMMMMSGSWSLEMFAEECDKLKLWMLMLAMITKSAQIPFSSWLPMAMAAPTPISALVHSSTLVTAGVYLMIRFNYFYFLGSNLNMILLFLAVMTMFMSGVMANIEIDLKKIIALSTLSQLGLMMMILGVGEPILAFYHLLIHAIFKSLMFLCAGIIIHLMMNNQDIRLLGNMYESIPMVMMMFLISNMALCGFPFMAGFYSKDLIMEIVFSNKINVFMLVMMMVSLSLTVMYSVRLMYYMFWGEVKFYSYMKISENSFMNLCMVLLMFLSIIIGSMFNWMFFFDYYVIYLKFEVKVLILMMCFMGLIMFLLINKGMFFKKMYYLIYYLSSMWFLNYMYMWIYNPLNMISIKINKSDKVWVEFVFKGMFELLMKYFNLKNLFSSFMFMSLYLMFLYFYYLLY